MRNGENMSESHQTYKDGYYDALRKFNSMPDKDWETFLKTEEGQILRAAADSDERQDLAKAVASKASWYQYEINSSNVVFDFLQILPLYLFYT
jgi:hypothetical protein